MQAELVEKAPASQPDSSGQILDGQKRLLQFGIRDIRLVEKKAGSEKPLKVGVESDFGAKLDFLEREIGFIRVVGTGKQRTEAVILS